MQVGCIIVRSFGKESCKFSEWCYWWSKSSLKYTNVLWWFDDMAVACCYTRKNRSYTICRHHFCWSLLGRPAVLPFQVVIVSSISIARLTQVAPSHRAGSPEVCPAVGRIAIVRWVTCLKLRANCGGLHGCRAQAHSWQGENFMMTWCGKEKLGFTSQHEPRLGCGGWSNCQCMPILG